MHRRLTVILAALTAAVLLAACGQSTPAKTKECQPHDYTMGCALPPVTKPIPPAPAPEPATATAVAASFSTPRLTYGIDFGWGGPPVSFMHAHGYRFGASYLSFDFSKNWPVSLIRSYAAAHIGRVFVWETTATRALDGCLAGTSDALAARGQVAGFGARAIYFAVDFEEQPSQAPTVAGYFRCAGRVLGIAHIGAYGGYWTVRHLFDAHLIRYGWQTYAWSGGQWDPRAQLEQYLNGSLYDYDRAIAKDYGQAPFTAQATRLQLQEQLWHLYRERSGVEHQVAVLSALLTKHGCRPPRHATPRSYHRHACPAWKSEGDASHAHLQQLARQITTQKARINGAKR